MICARCGADQFRVIGNVKRTSSGDLREVECTFCKQHYETVSTITHALSYDRNSMQVHRTGIERYKEQIEKGEVTGLLHLRDTLFGDM